MAEWGYEPRGDLAQHIHMLYAKVHNWLGWPDSEQAFKPSGAGAQVYTEFAQKKIQRAIEIAYPGVQVNVGVIATDPNSNNSETPLALICEFPRAVGLGVLDLTHKLAWNLSRTALLITLEPHQLVAWSCYQDPSQPENQRRICELPTPDGFQPTGTQQERDVRDLLHWVNLITQRWQTEQPQKFPADGRADALLLKNLRYVRGELLRMNLAREHCHDLLARIIFTQFLFHRKDSDGNSFFSANKMKRLHEDGVLSKIHDDLASVLANKSDTYTLFRWMDERFNGDLFPGKDGQDEEAREIAWRTERDAVSEKHLDLLAQLISGDLVASDKQRLLWRYYSFDTIPLEFISSVYEEFLTAEERGNDKAYYTPSHLVDYVLDAVLPWNSDDWNIRILDPCCGSAIFLVKAFQRLIHRWRRANKRDPLVLDLRPILEHNLVGVDKNHEAVRVACFSLYLAMADAIEPKHYITRDNIKVFPRLRGTRLIGCDFFDEDTDGIRTSLDAEKYDLVLGNAPWGDGSIRSDPLPVGERKSYAQRVFNMKATALLHTRAQFWAKANKWPVANNDIGPLFLAKAASLVKSGGRVAMVNTASLLYWRDGLASELRKKLFSTFTVDEVTNLSALRKELFPQAIGPACIIVFGTEKSDPAKLLHYFTPKATRKLTSRRGQALGRHGFIIEPQDVNTLTHEEAAEELCIWPTLAMGKWRDLVLIRKLMRLPNLKKIETSGQVVTRLGVIPGDRKKTLPDDFQKRRYFDGKQFPKSVFLEFDASAISEWGRPEIDGRGSTDFEAFKNPQLLIKQSLVTEHMRFRAVLVKSPDPKWGVICKETYLSVHDLNPDGSNIHIACIVYNSRIATYFLGLTSSRIGHYITETLTKELSAVPLPATAPDISTLDSFEAIDNAARQMFGLTTADWNLIEDFLDYTLPDALRQTCGLARQSTQRKDSGGIKEPELNNYAETFARVVKGTFGKAKAVASTIFTENESKKLPVRMLTIHLDAPDSDGVKVQPMEADGLLDTLAKFHTDQLEKKTRDSTRSGLGFQRVAYFFHPSREGGARVMNLTIVKPDERRYWTRSMAMRDADQLAIAIAKAAGTQKK